MRAMADFEPHYQPGIISLEHLSSASPAYKLSRKVRMIPELWKGCTLGLAGCPSVLELDLRWSIAWRGQTKRQYYFIRKRIIDEAQRRLGAAEWESREGWMVVETMEAERKRGNLSLNKVAKALKAAKTAAKGAD